MQSESSCKDWRMGVEAATILKKAEKGRERREGKGRGKGRRIKMVKMDLLRLRRK